MFEELTCPEVKDFKISMCWQSIAVQFGELEEFLIGNEKDDPDMNEKVSFDQMDLKTRLKKIQFKVKYLKYENFESSHYQFKFLK